jgi:hypothetical protein
MQQTETETLAPIPCEHECLFWLYLRIGLKEKALELLECNYDFKFKYMNMHLLDRVGTDILNYKSRFENQSPAFSGATDIDNLEDEHTKNLIINDSSKCNNLKEAHSLLEKYINCSYPIKRKYLESLLVLVYFKIPDFNIDQFETYANIINPVLTSYVKYLTMVRNKKINKVIEYSRLCYQKEFLDKNFVPDIEKFWTKINLCDDEVADKFIMLYNVFETEFQISLDVNKIISQHIGGIFWEKFMDLPIYDFLLEKGLDLSSKEIVKKLFQKLKTRSKNLTQSIFLKFFKKFSEEGGYDVCHTHIALSTLILTNKTDSCSRETIGSSDQDSRRGTANFRSSDQDSSYCLKTLIELHECGLDFSYFLTNKFPDACTETKPFGYLHRIDSVFANFVLDLYPEIRQTSQVLPMLLEAQRFEEFDRILKSKSKDEIVDILNKTNICSRLGKKFFDYVEEFDVKIEDVDGIFYCANLNEDDIYTKIFDHIIPREKPTDLLGLAFKSYVRTGDISYWDRIFDLVEDKFYDIVLEFLLEECGYEEFYFKGTRPFIAQALIKNYVKKQIFDLESCSNAIAKFFSKDKIRKPSRYMWVNEDAESENLLRNLLEIADVRNYVSYNNDFTINLDLCLKPADDLDYIIRFISITFNRNHTEIDSINFCRVANLIIECIKDDLFDVKHTTYLLNQLGDSDEYSGTLAKYLQQFAENGLSFENFHKKVFDETTIAPNGWFFNETIVKFILEQNHF